MRNYQEVQIRTAQGSNIGHDEFQYRLPPELFEDIKTLVDQGKTANLISNLFRILYFSKKMTLSEMQFVLGRTFTGEPI